MYILGQLGVRTEAIRLDRLGPSPVPHIFRTEAHVHLGIHGNAPAYTLTCSYIWSFDVYYRLCFDAISSMSESIRRLDSWSVCERITIGNGAVCKADSKEDGRWKEMFLLRNNRQGENK